MAIDDAGIILPPVIEGDAVSVVLYRYSYVRLRREAGRWLVVFAMLLAATASTQASTSRCPAFFAGGLAPDVASGVTTPSSAGGIHALCYRFYSVLESGVTRTPLWSAEHLTRDSVAQAHDETRRDAFHAEVALDSGDRAELLDYRGSGYDRGHMSPSGDMPDDAAQEESFSLANMVPQAPDNNRHLWQGIEIATRAFAKADGELYVVTGPAFLGTPAALHGRVHIPSHIWKAIYDPSRGAAAYITANRPGNGYAVVSIETLVQLTGIDPFPALSTQAKHNAMALPTPRPSGRRMKSGPVSLAALGIDPTDPIGNIALASGQQNKADSPRASQSHADTHGASSTSGQSRGVLAGDNAEQRRHVRDVAGRISAWLAPLRETLRPWINALSAYLASAVKAAQRSN